MNKTKATDLIEIVLRNNKPIEGKYPRDSDKALCVSVWQMQWSYISKLSMSHELEDFIAFYMQEALDPNTIARARRKFQQEGKYRGELWIPRQMRQLYMKQNIPTISAKGMVDMLSQKLRKK